MGRGRFSALAVLALALAGAARAQAQDANEIVSVTEREKLQQADLGIHVGSFLLLPSVDLSLSHSDNVYAVDTGKRGDFFADTRADISLTSQFSRHALNATAYYDRNTYFKLTTETTSQYGAAVDGRYDIGGDGSFSVAGGYDRVAESRTSLDSFTQATKPVLYDMVHGDASFTDKFGPLTAILGLRVRHYNYHDAIFGALRVDQSFRDFTIGAGTLDLAYDLHGLTNFVVHGEIERRRYDTRFGDTDFNLATMTDRSANGTRIEAGLQHEVTSLMQATVRLGWMHYSYPDPRLHAFSAFSYHADLIWNITPLTTIQGSADRRVDETVSATFAGNLRDEFRLDVRHELLRNLVLLADTRYAVIRPTSVDAQAAIGQTLARSHEFAISGGAHYYIGRYVRLEANFLHTQRRSDDPGLAFRENVATIGITFSR